MKIELRSDHDGDMPERLYLPDRSHCQRGHVLLDEHGRPTSNLQWDYESGRHHCGACADHWLDLVHAVLAHQQGGQHGETCSRGHPVSHASHDVRAVWRDGKLGVDATCKDCEAMRKALAAPPRPVLLRPGPRELHPQPVVPQCWT